ncbi:hypothetical protein, partial [Nesterenkonia sp. PF2B19]|uniref:hypothetical protein n=1 Tax=Nesterenkonia sp. PF2B19 TaxID=1881858 RepID=UPI00191C82D6
RPPCRHRWGRPPPEVRRPPGGLRAGKDAKSSGALAAGLAGASVAGITGSASLDDGDGAGSADTPPTPAPFDVDAT